MSRHAMCMLPTMVGYHRLTEHPFTRQVHGASSSTGYSHPISIARAANFGLVIVEVLFDWPVSATTQCGTAHYRHQPTTTARRSRMETTGLLSSTDYVFDTYTAWRNVQVTDYGPVSSHSILQQQHELSSNAFDGPTIFSAAGFALLVVTILLVCMLLHTNFYLSNRPKAKGIS
jgi:hypothetical protein